MQFEAPLRRPAHTVPGETSTDPFTMCIVADYRNGANEEQIVALYGVTHATILRHLR